MAPFLDPRGYKTYSVHMPLSTHWRKATCAEVDCPNYRNGWRVRVEHLPPELLHAARNSGRRFREMPVRQGETYLVFEAGQACFEAARHRKRLDRPELYVIRDGDMRGNPTGLRHEVGGQQWNDDFGEHQEKLSDLHQEG